MSLLAWTVATIVALNVAVLGLAVVRYFRHEPTVAEADRKWRARLVEQAREADRAQVREFKRYARDSAAARRRIAR